MDGCSATPGGLWGWTNQKDLILDDFKWDIPLFGQRPRQGTKSCRMGRNPVLTSVCTCVHMSVPPALLALLAGPQASLVGLWTPLAGPQAPIAGPQAPLAGPQSALTGPQAPLGGL